MLKTRMVMVITAAILWLAAITPTFGQQGGGGGGIGGGIGGGGGTGGGGTGGGGVGGGGTGGGGTGGGGTGGGTGGAFDQQQLNVSGSDFEFANIRQVGFAGVTRSQIVHPYTRVGQNAPVLTQGNVDRGTTGEAAGITQTNTNQAGGVTGFNAFNSPFGQFGFGGLGGFGGFGVQQQTPVRSSLTYAPTPIPGPSGLAASRQPINAPIASPALAARVRSIPGLFNAQVDVSVMNRTAIVTGLVATEEEKARIGRVLKLEPGVSVVDNRVQVQR